MCSCQASHAGVHGPNGEKDEEARGKIGHFVGQGHKSYVTKPIAQAFCLWQEKRDAAQVHLL